MFLAGVLGGMLWAAIPAVLRTRLNTSETLVTLMLTYIAQLLLSFLVRGPWRDPHGFNFPQTAMVPPGGLLEPLAPAYRVTGSVWFALVALAVLWLVTAFSFEGYKLGVGGRARARRAMQGSRSTERSGSGCWRAAARRGSPGSMNWPGRWDSCRR